MSADKLDAVRKIENIELIRDILFGSQIKDYSARIEHLENTQKALRDQTANTIKDVRDELDKRTEEIKQILREFQSAVKAIREDIKATSTTDADEKVELRQQIDRLSKRVATNVTNLDETIDKQVNSLRDDLFSSHRKQQVDILALRNEVFEELEKRLASLSSVKMTREDLAESFIELAFKLKGGELTSPVALPTSTSQTDSSYLPSQDTPLPEPPFLG